MMDRRFDTILGFYRNFFIAKTNLEKINQKLISPIGINLKAWQVLTLIHFYDDEECTTAIIAETLIISRQAVQKQIQVLIGEGLVCVEENLKDKRAPYYRISPKGIELSDYVVKEIYSDWMLQTMDGVETEAIEDASQLLKHIARI